MTDQYTYPPPVATYPGRGAMPPAPPTPPMPQFYPAPAPRKRKGANIAAVIGGAVVAMLTAGLIGGLIGNHMAGTAAAAPPPAATPPRPTAEQVKASTIDLCTRFAAGYRAMPSPQTSGFDVLPTANFIADALRDNPAADGSIRDAVTRSLALLREHAASASGEATRGAIRPPTGWTAAAANTADQKVWDLCRAYGS
ncbi:hypothetical protein I545_5972 [Mycobacterium kansasii 662]|uniref:Alanine and proline rich membrane protein n=2 Tax=Mycobacterium TaxID=1763 RepID=A0A1X1VWU8_MYCGO|nr:MULTISPECIES: hypothetical protein [Mycobacterium]EUA09734.1 hypothetical protein I545_5972 [Mycobacterium kansasii 662]MCV7008642.1 hypothetical protein [Mycobacterium gordonae]ORV73744.1 hypothetical protein AWC08_01680 [Mycobacterium gordonae]